MIFVNFWDNVSKKNTKEKYTVERRQMRADKMRPAKAGHWFEGKIGEKHINGGVGDDIKNLLENNIKNNIKSKNEIWRRITRPGFFGKLEVSNSPNR